MKINIRMTTAQFADLHNVNKKTLHYNDTIGLFSPKEKGENQYRYYDSSQSLTFEYIRILKGLNMSIEEIRTYMDNPNPTDFIKIIDTKSTELNQQIRTLKQTQRLLSDKKKQIQSCEQEKEGQFLFL